MFAAPALSYSVVELVHCHNKKKKLKKHGRYTEENEQDDIFDSLAKHSQKSGGYVRERRDDTM
jgi:hypothetical protein